VTGPQLSVAQPQPTYPSLFEVAQGLADAQLRTDLVARCEELRDHASLLRPQPITDANTFTINHQPLTINHQPLTINH
jgi:hypothetical protein